MIAIPYGKSHLDVAFPYNGLLTSRVDELKSDRTGRELVEEAMASPIGTPGLAALAAGKKRCTIIISDHTRPVPSRDILPPMLAQLRQGNPEIRVTLLVATGFHRLTTTAELEAKLGKEIADSEKIVVHDAFDPESNVQIGVLPSGAPLVIDRTAVDTDLLIAEGFIEPHFFAGFSGGRKSILPGVCDKTTVLGNHCGAFIASPYARTGILEGNPLHRDMVAAAEMAKLAYIVNVVIDEEKKTVAAFAGDFRKAHEAGVAFLRQYCEVRAVPGDIVVTGAMEVHDGFNAIAVEDFFIVFVNQWEDHRIKPGACIQRRADFTCAKFKEFEQSVVIRKRRWVTRVAENKRQDIVVLRLQGIKRLCRQVAVEHAGIHRLITFKRFDTVLKLFNFGAVDELGVVVHVGRLRMR